MKECMADDTGIVSIPVGFDGAIVKRR